MVELLRKERRKKQSKNNNNNNNTKSKTKQKHITDISFIKKLLETANKDFIRRETNKDDHSVAYFPCLLVPFRSKLFSVACILQVDY